MRLNIPNILSLLRLFLIPVFVVVFYLPYVWAPFAAAMVFWVAGFTGNPDEEFNDIKKCKENLTVNFVHPVLLIKKIIPKIIPINDSFIAVLTSVAGIRGRGKRLFYFDFERIKNKKNAISTRKVIIS